MSSLRSLRIPPAVESLVHRGVADCGICFLLSTSELVVPKTWLELFLSRMMPELDLPKTTPESILPRKRSQPNVPKTRMKFRT